jgi:hypothetical protein
MDEKALWGRAVRERPDAASRFGPPAWLVAERLPKAPTDCTQVEVSEAVAKVRAEYGLGEPQPMVRPTSYRSTRVHPPTHVEGACDFCVPTQSRQEDVPTPDVPTDNVCATCHARPREGRNADCAACRKRAYRQRQDTPGAAPS